MKPNFINTIFSSLSAKLSIWVVMFVAILFMATFSLMFYYARQAVREEAVGKAEDMLQKFEITIKNTFREKEVIAQQTHWNVEHNLDNPREIEVYLQIVMKNVPEIIGVAAAFEPGTFPNQKGDYMIYYHRQRRKIVRSDQFAGESYKHQAWYENTLKLNGAYWSEPEEDYRTDGEPIISYALPLHKNGETVGVFAIDVSLYKLSELIEEKRPSPTMYGALMTRSGAFIVHPDTTRLKPRAMFKMMEQYPDDKYSFLAYKILGGETGTSLMNFGNYKSFIVYKPFPDSNWVMDVVCPEDEIMGNYNYLISLMILIVVIALLMILAFCLLFVHREFVPLRMLESSAKYLIEGNYDTPLSESGRQDEVGSLTNSFIAMRRSIKNHIDEIDRNREKLNEQNKALNEANAHIKEADKVKAAFLQNMTDQMNEPVKEISNLVSEISMHHEEMDHKQILKLANKMDDHSKTITMLLGRVIEVSTKEEEDKA